MTTPLSEGKWPLEFILGEIDPNTMDEITIGASQTIVAGQVLGKIKPDTGTITVGAAAAVAGNTGNGTVTAGSPTYNAGVKEGTYRAVAIEPTTDLGKFAVEDPDGIIVGVATVGTAFNGPIKFTINDGATDFVSGDSFTWAVGIANLATLGQYVAHDAAATDGSQIADAIAGYPALTGAGETVKIAAVARNQAVKGAELTWKSGISADDKAAGIAALASKMIIVR